MDKNIRAFFFGNDTTDASKSNEELDLFHSGGNTSAQTLTYAHGAGDPIFKHSDPNINNTANKINSFYSKDVQKKRVTQKERILNAIKHLGTASDRELAEHTGIARHLIPDRRLSLMKAGLVEEAYSKTDPVTGKEVTYYKIKR